MFARSLNRMAGLLISFAASFWPTDAAAQPAPQETNAEVERESENPVTRFFTLPLRYKSSLDDGFYDSTTNTFEINNALVPVPLGDDWFLIARSKGAFVSQAPKAQGASWANGLNNAQTTLFFSPARGSGFFWGAGPVISFPTATNSATGNNQWGTGPSIALSWQRATHWTLALVANNVWGLGGLPAGSARSSNLLLNPIVSYRFGDGWSLSTSPNITANLAKTDNRWTVPVGGGLGKAFKIAAQPMSLKFETYYNAVRPDGASVWVAQLTLTFLFAR
jgi:hypothetical protein